MASKKRGLAAAALARRCARLRASERAGRKRSACAPAAAGHAAHINTESKRLRTKNLRLRRMIAGRTLPVLQSLQATGLFMPCADVLPPRPTAGLQPAAGLCATLAGRPVLIVEARVSRATVVPIVASTNKSVRKRASWVLRRRQTHRCSLQDLTDVGVRFQVVAFQGSSIYLTERAARQPAGAKILTELDAWAGLCKAAAACSEGGEQGLATPHARQSEVVVVLAAEAVEHLRCYPSHTLQAKVAAGKPDFLLSFPFPQQLDMRRRFCRTCKTRKAPCPVWSARPADVLRVCPKALIIELPAHMRRGLYVTKEFLLFLLQSLQCGLNSRHARRQIMTLFSSALLARAQHSLVPAPDIWASSVLAIPTDYELRALAERAFARFVKDRVAAMKSRQAIYNFAVIRGDGHFDLASRVKERDAATGYHHAPYSCVLGWCGLDGSLLKPFVLSAGESFEEQKADLRPYLEYARDVRQPGLLLTALTLMANTACYGQGCMTTCGKLSAWLWTLRVMCLPCRPSNWPQAMPRWCAATPATTS